MRRREIIVVLGAAAASIWLPYVASAQRKGMATLGVLASGSPNPELFFKGLQEGLRGFGYIQNQSVRLEFRSGQGDVTRLAGLASELVRLKVDIIVAFQTPAATAAKQATSDIPIVMAGVGDPVGTGLVDSLAKPGGNITGTSNAGAELVGKNVELLHEMLPRARRVAVLINRTDPFTKSFLMQVQLAGKALSIEMQPIAVRQNEELATAFAEMRSNAVDAVIVQPSLLGDGSAVAHALKARLPIFSINKQLPVSGGLASYSANYSDLYRNSARYVDDILKGRKPADLPVTLPTKFELVINLKAANALGLAVAPSMLTVPTR